MRVLVVLILLVLELQPFAALSQSFSGDSWEHVNAAKEGTITLAYVETPSLIYKNGNGRISGICADIINDFIHYVRRTKNVNVNLNWVGEGADFQGLYDKVKDSGSGAFGLGNFTITEARKKEIRFSPPFITNFAILITQTRIPMITRFGDLPVIFHDLNAYTVRGTINDNRIRDIRQKYFSQIRIIYTASSSETLDRVIADPNGMAYIDLAYYLHAVKEHKPIKRHPVGDKASENFGFVMPLTSDWAPLIDEFFNADGGYTRSEQYKRILIKHLGETGFKLLQTALE